MDEKWYITAKKADFYGIAKHYDIDPVTARLLRNRDLVTYDQMDSYLHPDLKNLYDPHGLQDIEKAAAIAKKKIEEGKSIRIISDYDCDGVCSNYILMKGFERVGAKVDYRIPHRIRDGYGLNERLVAEASQDGIDTIITCDNGIAAYKQIQYGKELGMTILVTDHHEVPYDLVEGKKVYQLPPADAVVDPKRADDSYPFSEICGAVVAWKFIQVLYEICGVNPEEAMDFIEIAALATNCDVMPLKDENRIIEKAGLSQMNHTDNVGLKALIEAVGLSGKSIGSYALGFVIGPCFNAAGRIASADEALELLLCNDKAEAKERAEKLSGLNEKRKNMSNEGLEEAKAYLEETGHVEDKVLIAYLPDLHESVAGIVAGKVRETYNKPSFVITRGREGLKGSGRSIEAFSMYDALSEVKECFTRFGGHKMAAGLSLNEDRLEEFRQKINDNAKLTDDDFIPKIHLDMQLPVWYLNTRLVEEFDLLEPFGQDNEQPLFADRNLIIRSYQRIGNQGQYLKLTLQGDRNARIKATYFGDANSFLQEAEAVYGSSVLRRTERGFNTSPQVMILDVCYQPGINAWGGSKSVEMNIRNYRFKR